jgi:hypothetical protein
MGLSYDGSKDDRNAVERSDGGENLPVTEEASSVHFCMIAATGIPLFFKN